MSEGALPVQIGPYRMGAVLGRGGMGTVYQASPLAGGADVALKLIRTDLAAVATVQRRFLRETRALCALRSPHVVRCLDFGWDPPVLWMAMELMPGGDLAARMRRDGRLPPNVAVRAIREAAAGVQAMHEAGLLHRDLKPANLFCANDGAVKVADLGLVAFRDDAEDLTALGDVIGTPAYLAPEQAMGSELDARCDVYSLGATLYALLVGRAPFSGGGAFAVVAQVLRDQPQPLTELVPDLPPQVVAVVDRAMAKDPAQRFASAAAFSAALAAPQRLSQRLVASVPRRRMVLAGCGAGLAIALVGAVVTLRHAPVPPAPAPVAEPAVVAVLTPESPAMIAPPAAIPEPAAQSVAPSIPVWATAAGTDASGEWADLALAGVTQRLRHVPSGTFTAGSPVDEPGRLDDEVQHAVRFARDGWIADTECTVALWAGLTGTTAPADATKTLPSVDHAWDEIQTVLARHRGRWPGMVLRLPTDREWEYACRAGATTAFGIDPAQGAWLAERADGALHPVGQLAPNAWGLFDCHGNAREWCADGYASASDGSPKVDPIGAGYKKVVRGGSFLCRPTEARSALRLMERPGSHAPTLGFRLFLAPVE